MKVNRTISIREDQDQRLVRMAAKIQAKRGRFTSISEITREALDIGLAIMARDNCSEEPEYNVPR